MTRVRARATREVRVRAMRARVRARVRRDQGRPRERARVRASRGAHSAVTSPSPRHPTAQAGDQTKASRILARCEKLQAELSTAMQATSSVNAIAKSVDPNHIASIIQGVYNGVVACLATAMSAGAAKIGVSTCCGGDRSPPLTPLKFIDRGELRQHVDRRG